MSRRELVQLANKYKGQNVANYWASEKLDGTRCWWDGGASRGVPTSQVPWASLLNPKTGEPKKKIKPIATGLWSRGGNPIIAPDWFLNQLPSCLLDGELFAGRGNFQLCRHIVGGDTPGAEWDKIRYCVFGSPSFDALFRDGVIKTPSHLCTISLEDCNRFYEGRAGVLQDFRSLKNPVPFHEELRFLLEMVTTECGVVDMIPQGQLPDDEDEAKAIVEKMLASFLDLGGEGLVLRCDEAAWEPKRSKGLLKVKPEDDDEGTITGFTAGRETNKGSKLLGMIGALILDYKGQRMELSGLNNLERGFSTIVETATARCQPGEDMPATTQGKVFRVGDKVSFKYCGLTDKGLPKFARYWRKRGEE